MKFDDVVYRRYERQLTRYLDRRMKDKSEVSDVAQEVCERLVKVKDFAVILEPLRYLYRVAASVLFDRAKAARRTPPVEYDSDLANQHPQVTHPSIVFDQVSEQLELEQAMAELEEKYRDIVLLRVLNGWSFEKIGQELELRCSAASIKQYFYRTMREIKQKKQHLTEGRVVFDANFRSASKVKE